MRFKSVSASTIAPAPSRLHNVCAEEVDWCDANGVGYIFGLAGNSALDAMVAETARHLHFWHAMPDQPKLRYLPAYSPDLNPTEMAFRN